MPVVAGGNLDVVPTTSVFEVMCRASWECLLIVASGNRPLADDVRGGTCLGDRRAAGSCGGCIAALSGILDKDRLAWVFVADDAQYDDAILLGMGFPRGRVAMRLSSFSDDVRESANANVDGRCSRESKERRSLTSLTFL